METFSTQEYFRLLDSFDICVECNKQKYQECCDKCGNAVCLNKCCSEVFPHYYDSLFVVCRTYNDEISSRLKIQINHQDLELLKNKIKLGKTRSFEKLNSKINLDE